MFLYTRDRCKCEIEHDAFEYDRYIQQITEQTMKARSGLVGKLAEYTLSNFTERPGTEKGLRIAREYIKRFPAVPRTIVYHGSNGVGKTHLACAIGNRLLDLHVQVRYVNVPEMIDCIQKSFNSEYVCDPIPSLLDCKVLIIDELGKDATSSDWYVQQVYRLINSLYVRNINMIVTTKQPSKSGLATAIGTDAIDRLLHDGRFVHITATSYRQESYKRQGVSE
jgi:DNA replication protein DnaC